MAKIEVQPLDENLSFGAKAFGVTKDALEDQEVRAQLNELFENRGVIVFKNVEQTPEMQVAISEVFGPLKDHPVASVATG